MATPLPVNVASFSALELAQATGGTLHEIAPQARVVGIASDSRMVQPGQAFVALSGETFDGHVFVARAHELGAALCVVKAGKGSGPRLEVADTLVALGAIAALHLRKLRAQNGLRVLGVGGAVGKTTTKTLLAEGARAYFERAAATVGNLNNRVGVPHTLLALDGSERAAVIECGTSERGEITALGAIVQPDVALVLNVDVEHTEGLGTLDDVADEEAALFAHARSACVTWAQDDRLVARLPTNKITRRFGTTPDADVQLVSRVHRGDTQEITLRVRALSDATFTVRTRLLGAPVALNFAAAACALAELASVGGDAIDRARFEAALAAMAQIEPVSGRFVPMSFGAGGLLFDDTYNANPKSVLAAIASAKEIADALSRPLVLCLGEMRELGAYAPVSHDEVLAAALDAKPRKLMLVGADYAAAVQRANANVPVLADSVALAAIVKEIDDRDVVLIKGSRGVRMERVVEALRGRVL